MKQSVSQRNLQPVHKRKSGFNGSRLPLWAFFGNGLLTLLFGMGIVAYPYFERGPSVSQAVEGWLNCRPSLFHGFLTEFGNPSPSFKPPDGSTSVVRQEESTWEVPYLNSESAKGQGADSGHLWEFDKSPGLVQNAAIRVVSLFSSKKLIQFSLPDLFLQDCADEQQINSTLGLLGNPQLTGAPVQQNDTPADSVQVASDEKMGVDTKQSIDGQAQTRIFVGTVIADEGANLRSGPSLDYSIVDKWSQGQQFPFEMASADGEWLRINEGLWISASIVAGQEISETSPPADMDSPEHPVPIIKASRLGQRFAIKEGDRIFLGTVSVLDGANIRSGPSLHYQIVSAVSFGSLSAWVAMSEDREWLYLQNGHWISADLVAKSKVYRIINTGEVMEPADDIPVIDTSQEQFGLSHGTEYLATVILESGAGIRSGPGFKYALVATEPLGQELVYVAKSENGAWLLLEDGNWVAAFQVSTHGFDDTYAARVQGEDSVPSSVDRLEMGEVSELSMELLALRQQAFEYVNETRTSQGFSPVRLGENQAAQNRSAEMIPSNGTYLIGTRLDILPQCYTRWREEKDIAKAAAFTTAIM